MLIRLIKKPNTTDMFDGIEDYNYDGTPVKNNGCLIILGISVFLILLGYLIK